MCLKFGSTVLRTVTVCLPDRYAGYAWIGLQIGGGGWEVRVKGNVSQRADSGRVNTSPVTAVLPVIRLQQGCNHTIEIPGTFGGMYILMGHLEVVPVFCVYLHGNPDCQFH